MKLDVFFAAVAKKRALLTLPSALIPEKPGVIQHPRTVLILSGLLGCGTHGYFRVAARKWISRCPDYSPHCEILSGPHLPSAFKTQILCR
jgi:hypothetical protein